MLLGGGRRHFLPKSAQGSRRGDGRNMEQYAQVGAFIPPPLPLPDSPLHLRPILAAARRVYQSHRYICHRNFLPQLLTETQFAPMVLRRDPTWVPARV